MKSPIFVSFLLYPLIVADASAKGVNELTNCNLTEDQS